MDLFDGRGGEKLNLKGDHQRAAETGTGDSGRPIVKKEEIDSC